MTDAALASEISPRPTIGLATLLRRPQVQLFLIVFIPWFAAMVMMQQWHLFATNWFMSLTMVVGSFIAGATSEGGGAVAFPVMTLLFHIPPHVARDFSLLIQSVGMISAAIVIWRTGIPIETRAILWAGLGGAIGVVIGIEVVAGLMPPAAIKMFFLSVWLSFAAALFWVNRRRDRHTHPRIVAFGLPQLAALIGVGIVGGIISGLTGSGLDILTFSLLVLGFRLDERVATATSVVLMGMNALVGATYAMLPGGYQLSPVAWNYWWVCVPVVVVGAPLGARFIANRSRLFVARLLYFSIVMQYVAGLLIIPQTRALLTFSLGTTCVGCLLFRSMTHLGENHLNNWLAKTKHNPQSSVWSAQ